MNETGKMIMQFNVAMDEVYCNYDEMTAKEFSDLYTNKYKIIEGERKELMDTYMEIGNAVLLKCINNPKDYEYDPKALRPHMVETLDALADIVYTCYFMANCFNLDLDEAINRVHQNNMTKLGPDGKPIKADGTQIDPLTKEHYPVGKVLKPEGFVPVDLTDLVL